MPKPKLISSPSPISFSSSVTASQSLINYLHLGFDPLEILKVPNNFKELTTSKILELHWNGKELKKVAGFSERLWSQSRHGPCQPPSRFAECRIPSSGYFHRIKFGFLSFSYTWAVAWKFSKSCSHICHIVTSYQTIHSSLTLSRSDKYVYKQLVVLEVPNQNSQDVSVSKFNR